MKAKLLASLVTGALFFSACTSTVDEEVAMDPMTDDMDMEAMGDEEMVADVMPAEEVTVELASFTDFDQAAYDAALAEGKDVFLDFHAEWCSTCLSNSSKIEGALDAYTGGNLVGFRVDYDNSSALQKELSVTSQSTLVLIKGGDVAGNVHLGPGLVSQEDVLNFLES